ncbi:RcpC/CpaB family pilus assembly protein [Sciscionella sediminilitoris]|uniref:RcpC/CpaB family pilus assembly protein n=1 Tax=Sciscionella sediminilitoris TaxID=1445613 RepID=UPI0007C77BC4|nr:RcpC/CpaB family pilus assembly protein [Sciscionella sp. SE31]
MTTNSLRTPLRERLGPALANRLWPRTVLLRRLLAGALFVLAIVLALLPGPASAGPMRPVLTTAHDLDSGVRLRAADLRVRLTPANAIPAGALTSVGQAEGRALAGAARAGEQLTDTRLAGPASAGPGRVAVPVRLGDTAIAGLLHPGTLVDVIAGDADTGQGQVLATGARVVTVPPAAESAASASSAKGDRDGRLVVLALPADTAHRVAASSLHREVTVTLQ